MKAVRHRHDLVGCRPEPLASYLKALGVLRLISAQADSDSTGRWTDDGFVLRATLDEPALVAFFLDEYRPTPLVTPWNGGSGFHSKDKKGRAALTVIERTDADRFATYRATIERARRIAARGESKGRMIERCRAELPDEAVDWLDAAVVLAGDGELRFPLLLGGTGGNLGRLDLPVNFMDRLSDVLGLAERKPPTRERREQWLRAALFADADPPRLAVAIGQFDPAGASGVNSSPLGAANSLANPWDFVLLLEGALVFASAAARRLSAGSEGTAAMPFTVASTRVGYGSSAVGEKAKGEIWAPLWTRPATATEISRLVSEGRATWGRRQARTGLDFARATASLGVDRGITSFVRFGLVERHGQSMLAIPLGRVQVSDRRGVPLLRDLDGWLERVRRATEPPAAIQAGLRACDTAMFALASDQDPRHKQFQAVLIALGALEGAVSRAGSFRDRSKLRPLTGLPAQSWLELTDDGTAEFRLATALASQRDDSGKALRALVTPVEWHQRRWRFTDRPAPVPGLGQTRLLDVLARALAARAIEVQADADNVRPSSEGDPDADAAGVDVRYRTDRRAPLQAVDALLCDEIDEERLSQLLRGMLVLDWDPGTTPWRSAPGTADAVAVSSPLYALLAPLFHGRSLSRPAAGMQGITADPAVTNRVRLRIQPTWPALLRAGRLETVAVEATRRLAMAGTPTRQRPRHLATRTISERPEPGARIAAALLCPLFRSDAQALLRRVAPPPLEDPVAAPTLSLNTETI